MDFPNFMISILTCDIITLREKIIFKKTFGFKYLTDEFFREMYNGKYICFKDGIFVDVVDDPFTKFGGKTILFLIS